MSAETGDLYSILGRRIAEIRKERNLSQRDLASSLTQKRTQAWVSNVESGRRNINAFDLYEIAAVFEIPVSDLFESVPRQPASTPKALSSILNELSAHLPSEIPIYLQREIADPAAVPIDYQYGPIISLGSIFDRSRPFDGKPDPGRSGYRALLQCTQALTDGYIDL